MRKKRGGVCDMITATKYTDLALARKAIEKTSRDVAESKATLDMLYRWEHSPMRTQMFWIDMDDIPTFCSVHTVRHKIWVEHFVTSNRPDRGGSDNVDRNTPVNHGMWCNAETLISMARKRLCYQASQETRQIMLEIKEAVRTVDPALAYFLVPNCVYRGGLCVEPKPCGNYRVRRYCGEDDEKEMMT